MYASLSKSYQWNIMNHDNAITNRVAAAMKDGVQVNLEQVSSTLKIIQNRLRSPLMTQITESLKTGRIVMLYADQIKIPLYLPFLIIQPSKGSFVGVVFLNHCECAPGETEYNVDARKLKASLESCYLALRMVEMDSANNTKLIQPSIVRPATKIYAYSIIECLNKRFSIKLDQTVYNQVMFMISRFFIGTTLGYNPDSATMENFCLYNCTNPDLQSIRMVNDQFVPEDFENIATFITKLASIPELKGRLGKLTVSGFVESYINTYNAPMTLAMESFQYLVFNIISVLQTTYVNNYRMLKNIVGDDGNKLYAQLIAILSE